MSGKMLITGNEAVAYAAINAGMNYFAGYPITPATEIAELCSQKLLLSGGVYMQMEDELAAICSVVGASLTGARAMTATSGPGFSLMQEGIGLAITTEAPCVIVNVMRRGPNQGVSTLPAQGDILQAVFGTNGDHPAVVIAPAYIEELYIQTMRAFDIAEMLLMPVIVLSDAYMAHMSEMVDIESAALKAQRMTKALSEHVNGCGHMRRIIGRGERWCTTGLLHNKAGLPITDPKQVKDEVNRLLRKTEDNKAILECFDEYLVDDAEIVIVGIGVPARNAMYATELARSQGKKVGVFRPVTLWPFPEKRLKELADGGKRIITCEMNGGQLNYLCKAAVSSKDIHSLTLNSGEVINVKSIAAAIDEVYYG